MTKEQLVDDLVAEITREDLFTKDEAIAILRSIRSDTKDNFPEAFSGVVTWARKVRSQTAILDTVLQLGKAGVIGVMPTADGDISLRLEPGEDEDDE